MDQLFAERMAEARDKIAKLTQHEAAAAAGVSRTMISRYETGESVPKIKPLTALARAYGVNPTWLLTGEEPKRWNPRASGESERERIVQSLRIAGGWLLMAVESNLDVLEVMSEDDMPLVEDPREGEDGGKRGVGTPRAEEG